MFMVHCAKVTQMSGVEAASHGHSGIVGLCHCQNHATDYIHKCLSCMIHCSKILEDTVNKTITAKLAYAKREMILV